MTHANFDRDLLKMTNFVTENVPPIFFEKIVYCLAVLFN